MKPIIYSGIKLAICFFIFLPIVAMGGRTYSFDFKYPPDRPPAHDLKVMVFYYDGQVVDGDRSGTITMTSRDGNTSADQLWNGGEPVDGVGHYWPSTNSDNIDFDMEGDPPIQPGETVGLKIQLDGSDIPWFFSVNWTDKNGYVVCDRRILRNIWGTRWLLGEWSIPSNVKNLDCLSVSRIPNDNNIVAAIHLPETDTVDFTLYTTLLQGGNMIDLGTSQGTIIPLEGSELIFDAPIAQNGDTLFLVWDFINRSSGLQFQKEVSQVIEKGTIFTQGDTFYWSEGEEPVTGIYFLGGEGVEVSCLEIPDFHPFNPEPDFFSGEVVIPPEFENLELFELTFIRMGPVLPGSSKAIKGMQTDTARLTVRHANFQPAVNWTAGDGNFEPVEGLITFPLSINREAGDEDWANIEIFSEQLPDTSFFHKRIEGTHADFELPLELDQSIWEQVENLTLKISMRYAPSFPVELLAIINSGQGIDDKVLGSSFTCYPNPFGQSTAFYIKVVKQERAKLSLYQHTGKLLTILYDGIINPGKQTIIWSDVLLPAGVYYYIYETETDRKTGKVIKLW